MLLDKFEPLCQAFSSLGAFWISSAPDEVLSGQSSDDPIDGARVELVGDFRHRMRMTTVL